MQPLKDFGYTTSFHFIPVRAFRTDKFINNSDFLFVCASVGILLAYINPVDKIIQYFGSKFLDFRRIKNYYQRFVLLDCLQF